VKPVLIVEDSRTFGSFLAKRIELEINVPVEWRVSFAEATTLLSGREHEFSVGLLDLNLPDAPNGEIIELVMSKNIPVIVFTGDISDEVQDLAWSKGVVDYVPKEGVRQVEYILFMIRRLERNRAMKVLVVDDSSMARKHIAKLLRIHQYEVFEACDGADALKVMSEHEDIRMVTTDYNMPKMDGFQLTQELRGRSGKEQLAIIGISSAGDKRVATRFIKNGANDFIDKPFTSEQFYCRITQNAEMLDRFVAIEEASRRDFLTGLYNRRLFFDTAEKVFANAKRSRAPMAIAMIDIDFFKKINDTHGHSAGDETLKRVAAVLSKRFRESDIVARFGGEEFCVACSNMDAGQAFRVFDELREEVEQTKIEVDSRQIDVSVSIGVCTTVLDSLDAMIQKADALLYAAKRQGRNCVVGRE
jgi:diguanylate cyclase (GGDEF)-like protein